VSTLIPIPEAGTYGTTLLALYAGAPFALSAHLQGRWGGRFLAIHCGVLAAVVVAGMVLLRPGEVVGGSPLGWLVALPLGAVAAPLVIRADRELTRRLARLAARRPASTPRPPGRATVATRPILTGHPGRRRALGGGRGGLLRPDLTGGPMPLALLATAAVLEELVYRGILVRLALDQEAGAMVVLCLAGGTVAFILGHGFLGWTQLVAKIPLGVAALGLRLATGTVLAPAVAHALFNASAWRQRRDWTPHQVRDLSAARRLP